MTVVIDANALVALLAGEQTGPAVTERIDGWIAEGREIHAPTLARYEIANVLARQLATGQLSRDDVTSGWKALEELPITYHGPTGTQRGKPKSARTADRQQTWGG